MRLDSLENITKIRIVSKYIVIHRLLAPKNATLTNQLKVNMGVNMMFSSMTSSSMSSISKTKLK
jgi:hypothetical protein